jgi:hypothetical protein
MSLNRFQDTQYVLDEVLIRYINYLNFAKVANRNFEGDYKNLKYATGQTINYRLEERFLGGNGATATAEGLVQVIRPLTINQQFNSAVEFTGMELTFNRARDQPYLDMMLNPRAKRLANKAELFIANTIQPSIWQFTGTPGQPISFGTIAQTNAYMIQLGIPDDGNRYFAIPPLIEATLATNLSTIFNGTVNRGALMDGFVGHLASFDFFTTNFLTYQTAGVGASGASPPTGFTGAGTISNGPVSGGNTLQITGVTAAAGTVLFNVGDKLYIDPSAGSFMINPENYLPIVNQGAQFVVTAQVLSLGSGTPVNIPVNPTIVVGGARANISAAIPNGAQVWLALSHNESLAFHNQAIVFAAPAIKELKGGVEVATSYSDLYKLAITYTLGADVRNYEQFERLDVLGGCSPNPEFGVIVMS